VPGSLVGGQLIVPRPEAVNISPALSIPLFIVSVAVTMAAASLFADRLDHVGPRLGLSEPLVGLLTALAADGPEISSALIALAAGEKAVSMGVVLGSNVFNLAAMIGVSALLAGTIHLTRRSLMVEGAVALIATAIAAGLILGVFSAGVAIAAFVLVAAPYLVLLGRGRLHDSPAEARARDRTIAAIPDPEQAIWKVVALIVVAVALIILGSEGMVRAALSLAGQWHLSHVIVGVLILAILTSLPNAFTAIRLGTSDRGTALVSETLNSNTINLAGGVMLPALIVGLGEASGLVKFDLAWFAAMTLITLLLLSRPGGARRLDGAVVVALYLGFVAVHLAHG
jgi:cation:H+ antiporter